MGFFPPHFLLFCIRHHLHILLQPQYLIRAQEDFLVERQKDLTASHLHTQLDPFDYKLMSSKCIEQMVIRAYPRLLSLDLTLSITLPVSSCHFFLVNYRPRWGSVNETAEYEKERKKEEVQKEKERG